MAVNFQTCDRQCRATECPRKADIADFFTKSDAFGRVEVLPTEMQAQALELNNHCRYAHDLIKFFVELEALPGNTI